MNRSPVITGLGIVGAPGLGVAATWKAIESAVSGLRPLQLFASPRYGQLPVGEVPEEYFRTAPAGRGSRSDRLAWIAADEAVRSAGIQIASIGDRAGVILGSSVGGSFDSERFLAHLIQEGRMLARPTRFHECVSSVESLADRLGAFGPGFAVATACSSGALAIAAAAEMIQSGEADVMITGGADSLSRMTWGGFHSLLLVDADGCRPFDAGRAGMSLGEGGGVLILEAEETARARGAAVLARLTGWGASCDAYHATAPRPDGSGAVSAMRAALARAGLEAAEIDYINAHGTGTRDNDLAESRALQTVFGTAPPPFSSTKRFFGHALAASGAMEAVVCVEALRRQAIPPNPGFNQPDPALGLSPLTELRPARLRHVMSNSFGFGGNNAVLIFSDVEASARPRSFESRPVTVSGIGLVRPEAAEQRAIEAPLPPGSVLVRSCGQPADAAQLTSNQRRRLSRLLQLTLVAARRGPPRDPAARLTVAVGSGLGCLEDAGAFIENHIALSEREPMPARFPNSVHNAAAAQLAMDQQAQAMNSAPTAGEISFECALWQCARQLTVGEADRALAGAVDELNKYPLALGKRWNLWSEKTIPGEGAAVVSLAPLDRDGTGIGRVLRVRLGRYRRPMDVDREASWIAASADLARVARVFIGAGVDPALELTQYYHGIISALQKLCPRPLEIRTYKEFIGEFPAASAFGFASALESLEAGQCALLFTLARRGGKALCVLER